MAKLTLTSFIVLAVVGLHATYGMDCTLGQSQNVVDQFINSCPRPLIDSESEKYCCWSPSGDNTVVRCCNLSDFTFNSISILLPFIIIGLIVSFIVSCICCLCCPCCCVYKRRSGGRVLRPGPMIVTVGPYAAPPSTPYHPLSDGWAVA